VSANRAGDTIVAIGTAPGRGALAIVRVSGARSHAIGRRLVHPWPAEPRHATLARVLDERGEALDEGIVVRYDAPASFTGEDALEVTSHGGAMAPAAIAAAFVAAGARPAEPGEFTRRAVLNGKLDLLQAEGIADLVDASSRSAQRAALSQLDGGLSRRIGALREQVLGLEALAAYDIDFPEEDDGPIPKARILGSTQATISDLSQLLATAPVGELVREGAAVVIAGAPNVGKSSLFNALLGRRRAIVTEIPGTTRDALEALSEADGWPIRLIDTAGLRETSELVEQLGIEVSREYVQKADVILVCGETPTQLEEARAAVTQLTQAPLVLVRTKADLSPQVQPRVDGVVPVSASTGEGLAELMRSVAASLREAKGALTLDAPIITRARHRFALEAARDELRQFEHAFAGQHVPAVVAAVHLREATRHLEELIGVVDVEDVLSRLFATFCVGK
jgi:tRNA modification GTPase